MAYMGRYNPLGSSLRTYRDVVGAARVRRSAALAPAALTDHLPVVATAASRASVQANIHRHIQDIERWLKSARRGSRKAYHKGYLAKDRFMDTRPVQPLHAVSEHLYNAANAKRVALVQKREGDGEYIYYVVKR